MIEDKIKAAPVKPGVMMRPIFNPPLVLINTTRFFPLGNRRIKSSVIFGKLNP
jgi:hypothetical protein